MSKNDCDLRALRPKISFTLAFWFEYSTATSWITSISVNLKYCGICSIYNSGVQTNVSTIQTKYNHRDSVPTRDMLGQ
jgi:hypothetical protein